jgi:hypothetical protein
MSKKTSYSSVDGKITGKTHTARSGSGTRTTTYTRSGNSLGSPSYRATSTTVTDRNGNSRTKKY